MLLCRKILVPLGTKFVRKFFTGMQFRSDETCSHVDTEDNNECTPFNFTEDNERRLDAVIKNYPKGYERAALQAACDLAQRQEGWVSIAAMNKIAEVLEIPRMRVYEWVTFYTMNNRRFKGKYLVKICVTTPCMLRGADELVKVVENCCQTEHGHVSANKMFGVEMIQCAGACVNAPVLVINDDYYEDVTSADAEQIINCIKTGQVPQAGPRNGRFSCEPLGKMTSLCNPPPAPGFGVQKTLLEMAGLC